MWYTALFNCGPCDNFRYLGHTENPDDDDDDDDDDEVNRIETEEYVMGVCES